MNEELSHIIRLDRVTPNRPYVGCINANDQQCALIAERLQIIALDSFSCEFELKQKNNKGLYVVSGHVEAALTQSCVVSLEPVKEKIDRDFEVVYTTKPLPENYSEDGEMLLDHEDPEYIEGTDLDIGEVIIQSLSLLMNPYPRANEHADKTPMQYGEFDEEAVEKEEEKDNPFAVLKGLDIEDKK